MRTRLVLIVGVAVVALVAAFSLGTRKDSVADPSAAFFGRYVKTDGRVARIDEGGDTVSEGQAYALLLAARDGHPKRFAQVWEWTRDNLQRPDGLFSWHWQGGDVIDESPAADADIDIARALLQAGDRFGNAAYIREGERVARAVLAAETTTADGRRVLVPGPWAIETGAINPSYLDLCAFSELAELTRNDDWTILRAGAREVLDELLADGLPSDWATIRSDGRVVPSGPPEDASADPQYGLDAVRVVTRLASCDEGARFAADLWPSLRDLPNNGAGIAYTLDGHQISSATNAAGVVAASAAADAADDTAAATTLLRHAVALERATPTYYGAAWVALHADELSDGVTLATTVIAHGRENDGDDRKPPAATSTTMRPTSSSTAAPTTVPTTTPPTTRRTAPSSTVPKRPPTTERKVVKATPTTPRPPTTRVTRPTNTTQQTTTSSVTITTTSTSVVPPRDHAATTLRTGRPSNGVLLVLGALALLASLSAALNNSVIRSQVRRDDSGM